MIKELLLLLLLQACEQRTNANVRSGGTQVRRSDRN